MKVFNITSRHGLIELRIEIKFSPQKKQFEEIFLYLNQGINEY